MYDPRLMRFLTTDPIGVSGGMNIYAYVGGDPVNYVDPYGLCPDGERDDGEGGCEPIPDDAITITAPRMTNNQSVGVYFRFSFSFSLGNYHDYTVVEVICEDGSNVTEAVMQEARSRFMAPRNGNHEPVENGEIVRVSGLPFGGTMWQVPGGWVEVTFSNDG
jgi:uncharacterized protein RhaS with RHS repeats